MKAKKLARAARADRKAHWSPARRPIAECNFVELDVVDVDKSGKVDRIANYGMKDGKVFDFVSRTTPTGGSEPDFLKNMMGGLFRFS